MFTRLEELAGNASMLNKMKIQLNNQLDEAKRMADDEAKERQSLLGRFRTLEHEFDGVKIHFDDEVQQKEDVQRQVHKATGEMNHWRAKYEQEAVARIEELEATKLKLQARLAESESTMGNLNGKLIALEKAKLLLTKEIEDMGARVDQANMLYNQAEKKIKVMDKTIGEWKSKANGLSMELNDSQKECRNASAELFRMKNGYEDSNAQLESVKHENKTLGEERLEDIWVILEQQKLSTDEEGT